jgi:Uri superfamily endonuclease
MSRGQCPGTYVVLIEVSRDCRIEIGAKGQVTFPAGHYAYVGSAMGGLRGRLRRHLRSAQSLHWHIDYLLTVGQVREVVAVPSEIRLECCVATYLRESYTWVPGFGATDCRCPSHLFHAAEYNALRRSVLDAFRDIAPWTDPILIGGQHWTSPK